MPLLGPSSGWATINPEPAAVHYRQAFLWGVANYVGGLPNEELIIGFGIAKGTRARIESVMKVRGSAETVALSPEQAIILHGYLNEDERHTAILVHNHPNEHPVVWLLGMVFGEQPLPSLLDRDFGLEPYFRFRQSRFN
jgi:hypothetical protein